MKKLLMTGRPETLLKSNDLLHPGPNGRALEKKAHLKYPVVPAA